MPPNDARLRRCAGADSGRLGHEGAAVAEEWFVAVPDDSVLLGAIAALLGLSGFLTVPWREAVRIENSRERKTAFATGVLMLAILTMTTFDGSVVAFNARAFGAGVLGVPVTWVAALALPRRADGPRTLGDEARMSVNVKRTREDFVAHLREQIEPLTLGGSRTLSVAGRLLTSQVQSDDQRRSDRAMTIRCTSLVPSPISVSFASRKYRSTGKSRV
jgi:hypothetical protein